MTMRIVVLTSNDYHNCLVPFAHYWNRFAGTLRRVTVACYDAPVPELPDNFDVARIGGQADYTWSGGLRAFLQDIDDDVILLMLEDYFLTNSPQWNGIEQLCSLVHYSSIAKIDLTDDRMKVPHISRGIFGSSEIIESCSEAPFKTSLQAALWRVDFLKAVLEPSENAWQFEKYGSQRVDTTRINGQRPQILGTSEPPMQYANAVGGEGHKPGVIEAKHMPTWMWDECVAKGWARG